MTRIRAVLVDIEGTTSSIRFVHDVLFPYARARLAAWVEADASTPRGRELVQAVREELGRPDATLREVAAALEAWSDADRKVTPLKTLQGWIWEEGYARGHYRAHVYPDAVAALRRWHAAGLELAVYSSGSVHAQQLFFGHSEVGDLRPLFSGWFDTTTGPKREAASYLRIAGRLGRSPHAVHFLSDVQEELDAAAQAGMATTWVVREADPSPARHRAAATLADVALEA